MTDKEKWVERIIKLFPAAKGSVREVKKGCGYASCKRCASGEKHQAYLLTVFIFALNNVFRSPKPKLVAIQDEKIGASTSYSLIDKVLHLNYCIFLGLPLFRAESLPETCLTPDLNSSSPRHPPS